jgi:hypothetical protein
MKGRLPLNIRGEILQNFLIIIFKDEFKSSNDFLSPAAFGGGGSEHSMLNKC